MTPETSSSPIPPKNTKSDGSFVKICSKNTSTTTATTNHAAKLKPKNIIFFPTIKLIFFFFSLSGTVHRIQCESTFF